MLNQLPSRLLLSMAMPQAQRVLIAEALLVSATVMQGFDLEKSSAMYKAFDELAITQRERLTAEKESDAYYNELFDMVFEPAN
jgi:hypothetical protein